MAYHCGRFWRGVRVAEGARLESVYTVTPYRGFESLSLRQITIKAPYLRGFSILVKSKSKLPLLLHETF